MSFRLCLLTVPFSLKPNKSIGILEQIDRRYQIYREACLSAYSEVQKELDPISKRITEEGLRSMAKRIFLFVNFHLFRFDSIPVVCEEEMEVDRVVMPDGSVEYKNIAKRLEDERTVNINSGLSKIENQLITVLQHRSYFTSIFITKFELDKLLKEFRRVLSPDSRLKRLVFSGECDLCH